MVRVYLSLNITSSKQLEELKAFVSKASLNFILDEKGLKDIRKNNSIS